MPNSVDINLFTINRQSGLDKGLLPGFKAAARPRRTARGRENDQLMIYMTLSGSLSSLPEGQDKILSDLARTYYDTAGSITSALRVTTEALNGILLRRNLQSAGSSQQVIGLLTLLVLRGDQLYLSQSGPVHAYILAGGQIQHLYDPQLSGKGLGLGQTSPMRYTQAALMAGDVLLLAALQAPGMRLERMMSLVGQTAAMQRQRLSEFYINPEPAANLNAVFAQVQLGSGKVTLAAFPSASAASVITSQTVDSSGTAKPVPETSPVVGRDHPNTVAPVAWELSAGGLDAEQDDQLAEANLLEADLLADHYQPLPELVLAPTPYLTETSETISVSSVKAPESTAPQAPSTLAPARPAKPGLLTRAGRGLGRFMARLLPEDSIALIPNSVMALMALVIPLLIVSVSTAVYFRRGLAAQSDLTYQQAVEAAKLAQAQTEPLRQYEALNAAARLLDAADSYARNPQTQSLRQEVQGALDQLDQVKRLNYQPAVIGGLPNTTQISQVAPVDSDLYLLDSQSGNVLRTFFTDQGYQLDPNFQCGPNTSTQVGPLVDLNAWPVGVKPYASVAALDSDGNLLFCFPEGPAQALRLANPPNLGLKGLTDFSVNLNDLYVLDPANQAVWVYWSGDFENPPTSYFGDQPLPVKDVIDLLALNDELYLLHEDGRMTLCYTSSLGAVAPTRCTDPAPYLDTRPGRENTAFNLALPYTQVQYNPPPDPSLFLLVSKGQAVDRFSLRNLAFQRRFMPVSPLPGGEALAVAIDSVERTIYLAVGNQVYYANLP